MSSSSIPSVPHAYPPDQFDPLPDSLLLAIFNLIGDVKTLGRCCLVSHRFQSLVPHVDRLILRVDCVISEEDDIISANPVKSRVPPPLISLLRLILTTPLAALSLLFHSPDPNPDPPEITHHSPTQVLKNFCQIRSLRIELPAGELGMDEGVLLKWRAHFGSTLQSCAILGASHVSENSQNLDDENDNGDAIPESFYTNGGLKLRVVWTISSLIAASARHYLLQPILSEHPGLDRLVLTDCDEQGMLCMDREQLEELRAKPLSACSASKRTVVPALNMRLWYAPSLDLHEGVLLKGATLVAIQPREPCPSKEGFELSWILNAFEEPYRSAAKMLVKRKTYCLEMNSF